MNLVPKEDDFDFDDEKWIVSVKYLNKLKAGLDTAISLLKGTCKEIKKMRANNSDENERKDSHKESKTSEA